MYVYDFDVFLTEQIVVDTSSVLSFGKRCEDHGYSYDWSGGQKHLSEAARKYNATKRITQLSLFQACQPNLPARLRVHSQHRYRRTQCVMIRCHVQQPHGEGVHAVDHWEISYEIPKKPTTKRKMRTSTKHGEARCVICQNGWRNSTRFRGRRSFRIKRCTRKHFS